jgi:rhodanese-related sulfurtransferase
MSRLRSLLLGVALALCLLISAPQGAAAATAIAPPDATVATVAAGEAAAIDSAVEQYLSNLPGDFHAIRSVPALKRLLASGNVSLIDVRTPAEYRAGHIAGAINRPLNDLSRHVAEISPEREVVLYCSSGFRSAMGVMALQLEGRHQVKGFAPSIEGWKAAGEPVVTTEGA